MPIQADTVTIAQFQEAESNVDVIATTGLISASGHFVISTAVGQNDQQLAAAQLILSVGQGLSKDVAGQLNYDVPGLSTAVAASGTDLIMVDQGSGARKITRDDLIAGLTGTTNLDEGTATTSTVQVTSSTGTPATLQPASGTRAGLLTQSGFNTLQSALQDADLSVSGGPSEVSIDISSGTNTGALPHASTGVTGVLTGTDWNTFNQKLDKVDIVVAAANPTGVSIDTDNSLGGPQALPVADGINAGVINAADYNTFLGGSTAQDLSIGTAASPTTTVQIDITGGTAAVIPQATAGAAGVLSAADKTTIDNAIIHTGDISSDAAGVTSINPSVVGKTNIAAGTIDNTHMDTDAIDTPQILDNKVTYAKIQQVGQYSILGSDTIGGGNCEELTLLSMTLNGSPIAGDRVVGFKSTGELVNFDVGDISAAVNIKDQIDDMGNQSGAVTVDFDFDYGSGGGHIKRLTVTGDITTLQFTAVNPGRYWVWFCQNVTGGFRIVDMAGTNSPLTPPALAMPANACTVLNLTRDHNGTWHW